MYDHNGLELSPVDSNTMNSYKFTAVDLTTKRYWAYARSDLWKIAKKFSMHNIHSYKDPRDAAFVGQEFNKAFSNEQVRELIRSGDFRDVVNEFLENLEIPVWKYPAEGLLIEDILNDYKFEKNYCDTAQEALREYFANFDGPRPALDKVKRMIARVEKYAKENFCGYRVAVKNIDFKI